VTVAEGAGQLPVPFRRAEAPAFGNFFVEAGAEVVDGVRRLVAAGSVAPGDLVNAAPKLLFLHGAPGSGKTHLLVAALRAAADLGQPVAYLDLADGRGGHGGVAAVDGLPPGALVCLDRADAVAGSKDGELNLFAIFERLRAAGARMLIAARAAPGHLPCAMPDLRTRLASGLTYRLPSLSDAGKAALAALVWQLEDWGFALFDCQVQNPHLASLGVREISRKRYLAKLARAVEAPGRRAPWRLHPATLPRRLHG